MNIPTHTIWHKMREINQINQELMESIQKKKRLRHKLQEMNQKKEAQQINDLTEWASFQTKLFLSDIERYEKKQLQNNPRTYSVDVPLKNEIESEEKDIEVKLHDDAKTFVDDDKSTTSEVSNNSNKLTVQSLSALEAAPSKTIIAELFGKRIKCENNNHSDTSSVSSAMSNNADNDIHEAQNKDLEALRKRIEKMKSRTINKSKSLKTVALSALFIEKLKRMVAHNRPKKAEEFNRTLSQILKPYTTLMCNALKLYSAPVFRSVMRNKITLFGYSKPKDIFTSIFKLKLKNNKVNMDHDRLLFIQVHVMKLIQCLNKYTQNAPDALIEFLNGYLLNDKPALFEYVYASEEKLLQWDTYNFVVNFTTNQKKMILLNFIAVRCMLQQVILTHVEGNKLESNQKMNLYCIASVFYYIIRSYNGKLFETNALITKDIEIGPAYGKLLEDDHPIYDKLDNLVEDGMNAIDTVLSTMMQKIEHINP